MDGGPSQVDTFDPKPRLDKQHGQPFADEESSRRSSTTTATRSAVAVEVPAARRERHSGQRPVSARRRARRRPGGRPLDDRASSPSTPTPTISCTPASACRAGRAWARGSTYGLGSECQDLPGFIVLNGGLIPPGGLDNFNSGFLPASYQGSIFRARRAAGRQHQRRRKRSDELQRNKLALLRQARSAACSTASATSTRSNRRSPTTSWPSACKPPCRS